MASIAPSRAIDSLIHENETVNGLLWNYNTHGQPVLLLEDIEDAIESCRNATRNALPEIHLKNDFTSGIIDYVVRSDFETMKKNMEGVSIVFRTMHRMLLDIISSTERPASHAKKQTAAEETVAHHFKMGTLDIRRMIDVAAQADHFSLTEDQIQKRAYSHEKVIVLGKTAFYEIASYAVCDVTPNRISIKEIEAAPGFEKTNARAELLAGFHYWIPHCVLKILGTHVMSPPINQYDMEEAAFFAHNDFIAYGGSHDTHGEFTHIHMGKLTEDFYAFKKLG